MAERENELPQDKTADQIIEEEKNKPGSKNLAARQRELQQELIEHFQNLTPEEFIEENRKANPREFEPGGIFEGL